MKRQNLEYALLESVSALSDKDLESLSKYIKRPKNKYKTDKNIDIFNSVHDFGLEGKRGVVQGEQYKCRVCGGTATVIGTPFSIGLRASFAGPQNCKFGILSMNLSKEGKRVRLIHSLNNRFGQNIINTSPGTVHTCVACPQEHFEKYHAAYWINIGLFEGPKLAPVRLLPNEFELLD